MTESLLDVISTETVADRQVAALHELSDHELADLGILRDQIEAFVMQRTAAPG